MDSESTRKDNTDAQFQPRPANDRLPDMTSRRGTLLGYARVSTGSQDLAGQRARLAAAGARRIYEDVISGTASRSPSPGLIALAARCATSWPPWPVSRNRQFIS